LNFYFSKQNSNQPTDAKPSRFSLTQTTQTAFQLYQVISTGPQSGETIGELPPRKFQKRFYLLDTTTI